MQTSASDEVLIRREGRAGRITMNRPAGAQRADATRWWADLGGARWLGGTTPPSTSSLLDGAGERALCAGGDVRALYDSRAQGSALARAFWSDEYRLNALIGRYPKPFVAIQDGIVMGGGIGLSGHARHRIVTERSRLAMPETGIGLIPDVGGTWLLAHAPGETGVYLGLTGEAMGAADAIYAGFADAFVPSAKLAAAGRAAGRCQGRAGRGGDRRAGRETRGRRRLPRGAPTSTGSSAAQPSRPCWRRWRRMPGEWAQKTAATLAQKSPKSLKLTLAAIRNARSLGSLEAALNVEYPPDRAPVRGRRVPRGRARADRRQGPQAQVVAGAAGRRGGRSWSRPTSRRCRPARSWGSRQPALGRNVTARGFRNSTTQRAGLLDPCSNRIADIGQCLFRRIAIGHAARQIWHRRNEAADVLWKARSAPISHRAYAASMTRSSAESLEASCGLVVRSHFPTLNLPRAPAEASARSSSSSV